MGKVHAYLSQQDSILKFLAEETPLDRELQSKEVGRIMGELYPQPVIFLGYLVTRPHAPRRKLTLRSQLLVLMAYR